jgi:apolipoprotein N-acyltransferase
VKPLSLFALAAVSGVLYFVGFIGFDQWYLEWIALVPLLVALDHIDTGRRAFFVSWFMGLVTHMGGYYWVVHLLVEFGQLPLPLAVLGYVLLCAVQGGSFALFGWLAWKLRRKTGIAIGWIAPIALIATEFAYPLIFQSYTANSQAWVPALIQIVDLGGVLLLSGVIALVNGAVAEFAIARMQQRKPQLALPIAAGVALAFTVSYGLIRMQQIDQRDAAATKLKVAIVQANVGAADKHENVRAGIEKYRAMTDAVLQTPNLDLVVWPESGFNSLVELNANLTGHVATRVDTPMLIGALRAEPVSGPEKYRIWNSILAVEPGGRVAAGYDKVKLLIFGESLPGYETFPQFYEWLRDAGVLPYISVFARGESFAPLPVGPYQLSADVCYEDILPRHIRKLMGPIDANGTRPHAMFNGTNDSWYGPVEPRIHLALSVFRAVEHRRWLIRSTVTGISAFIDSSGRIVEQSRFEEAETLIRDVPMITDGPTLYGRIGDLLGWLAVLFAASVLTGLFTRAIKRESRSAR